MLRFIRLGHQILGVTGFGQGPLADEHFAWYDTVTNQFLTTSDGQSQAFAIDELAEDILTADSPIRKRRNMDQIMALLPLDMREAVQLARPGIPDPAPRLADTGEICATCFLPMTIHTCPPKSQ